MKLHQVIIALLIEAWAASLNEITFSVPPFFPVHVLTLLIDVKRVIVQKNGDFAEIRMEISQKLEWRKAIYNKPSISWTQSPSFAIDHIQSYPNWTF